MKQFIYLFAILLFSCSTTSVEYRTATTSLRNDRDYNKAEELLNRILIQLSEGTEEYNLVLRKLNELQN